MKTKVSIILQYILIVSLVPTLNILVAQQVLYDNVHACGPDGSWYHFMDTLRSHGATVYRTTDNDSTGWDYLNDMDMFWIGMLRPPYTSSEKADIISFSRNGGKILIFAASDSFSCFLNPLLTDTRWQTGMKIVGWTWNDRVNYLIPFPPFTDGIERIFVPETTLFNLAAPPAISCGEHAYPFIFSDSIDYEPVVAISYPFIHEGNCSSFIVLITGTDWLKYWNAWQDNQYRIGANLVLGCAGVPGYELPPGAIPGGGFAPGCGEQQDTTSECFAHPQPFTPNGDNINDYAKFEYPGMHRNNGILYIYTLENEFVRELQNGEVYDSPKGIIYWDGKDGYGRLMQNGVYLYIVRDEGGTKCKGTIYLAR